MGNGTSAIGSRLARVHRGQFTAAEVPQCATCQRTTEIGGTEFGVKRIFEIR
jgi:hypothetical protein